MLKKQPFPPKVVITMGNGHETADCDLLSPATELISVRSCDQDDGCSKSFSSPSKIGKNKNCVL